MEEMFDILNENGNFTNRTASRTICHTEGLWHKAVAVFIFNSKGDILLQKRNSTKKLWPNLWDISAGGHVLSGEFGFESVIRETKEEINVTITPTDLLFIGCTRSSNNIPNLINNHFNEYYIVNKDISINEMTLQIEEVSDVKWISKEDLIHKINNNYNGLTGKYDCWDYLKKYISTISI